MKPTKNYGLPESLIDAVKNAVSEAKKELTPKQKQLDVDKDGDIEADDLADLRKGKHKKDVIDMKPKMVEEVENMKEEGAWQMDTGWKKTSDNTRTPESKAKDLAQRARKITAQKIKLGMLSRKKANEEVQSEASVVVNPKSSFNTPPGKVAKASKSASAPVVVNPKSSFNTPPKPKKANEEVETVEEGIEDKEAQARLVHAMMKGKAPKQKSQAPSTTKKVSGKHYGGSSQAPDSDDEEQPKKSMKGVAKGSFKRRFNTKTYKEEVEQTNEAELPKAVIKKGHEIAKSIIKHRKGKGINPYAVGMAAAKKKAGLD